MAREINPRLPQYCNARDLVCGPVERGHWEVGETSSHCDALSLWDGLNYVIKKCFLFALFVSGENATSPFPEENAKADLPDMLAGWRKRLLEQLL